MGSELSLPGASTRNRVLVIIGVIALSLWIVYPIEKSLKLGLDLNGGVQLVLRVKTDDALLLQTRAAADRLRTALTQASVSFSSVDVASATEFRVDNVVDEPALRRAADESASTYERTAAGGTYIFRLPPAAARTLRDEIVEQALRTIDCRVNDLGVAESEIARYTAADQILVQLPGVSDVDRAKQIIKSTAQLRLTLVDQGPFATLDAALLAYNRALPPELEILPGKAVESGNPSFYVVQRVPALTGNDLRNARPAADEFNRPAVGFSVKPEAAQRFGVLTERNINRPLATVLDNRVMSVATIQSRIDDQGRITGVSREEMLEQVINLNPDNRHGCRFERIDLRADQGRALHGPWRAVSSTGCIHARLAHHRRYACDIVDGGGLSLSVRHHTVFIASVTAILLSRNSAPRRPRRSVTRDREHIVPAH